MMASYSQLEMVQLLLKNNANVNHFNILGETALTTACDGGNLEIVKLLLNNHANINERIEIIEHETNEKETVSYFYFKLSHFFIHTFD